ncbi:T9SS type A sorting domain-containing protein [Polaribacter sp. M15]
MKKVTLLFALLTISLSFGQSLPITNGGFETGDLTDWAGFGTAVVEADGVVGAGTTKSGTYAGRINNWGEGASMAKDFDVVPGETYIVNFWFTNQFFYISTNAKVRNYTGDTNGDFIALTPIVADGGGNANNSENYQCTISDQNPSFDWKEAKFSFTAPVGVTKVRFQYYSQVGAFKYIDDFSVTKETTASVKDQQQLDFVLSPNPANDFIKISSEENINKVEIYNLLGKLVFKQNMTANKQINIADLSDGVYIIKASNSKAVGTYKLIKK